MPERSVQVLDAGTLTTVQDLGRIGHAHLGVPRSGALDEPALRLANRLVGNPESVAGLEITLSGLRLRLSRPMSLAVTGAECTVRVGGRLMEFGAALSAQGGSEVEIGPAARGARTYVALGGGIVVPQVLGSRSTDLLTGLGPDPVRAGDVLPVGAASTRPDGSWSVPQTPAAELRLRLGPRDDWFTEESVAALDGASYVVGADSNRIGLRLTGQALVRSRDDELPSEGMVLGAVQVPPSGQPLVFLNDHPTTGGYPVVGVVRRADLPVCAQARPGDRLTLRLLA